MTSSFDNFGNVVGTPRDKLPDISDTNYLRTEADLTEAVNKQIDENIKDTKEFYDDMMKIEENRYKAREALGIPAAYGAPVMLSPTDRMSGFLNFTFQALNTAASLKTAFSDKRLKENIRQVGISPQGYKIYEFNYIDGDVRFRGAMAQDVLQKNPMAVGIDQNYLTVDYRKIDVAMEVA